MATGYKEVDGWKPTEPADALARGPWWHIFNDGVLNGLEDQIDISNQNIKAAAAAVEQSQALVREAQAGYWPTLSVSASRTHGRRGGGAQPSSGSGAAPSNSNSGGASSGGGQYNSNSAGASLNWPLDIWGTVRRSVEGAKADEQTGEATLANARLSAQAQLASSYFQLRYQDQLQIILDDTVKADDLALKITENRYRVGVAARADVVQAQTQLLSAQASKSTLPLSAARSSTPLPSWLASSLRPSRWRRRTSDRCSDRTGIAPVGLARAPSGHRGSRTQSDRR